MGPARTSQIGRRRIVVCGATGFIGRNMAENLADAADRFEVVGVYHARAPFAHRGITWRQADLRDPAQVDQLLDEGDIVIQAAAVTSGAGDIVQRPQIHIADNAVMNSHLLRAAFERKVAHFVFFSCSIIYPPSERPQRENDVNGESIAPHYFGAAWTKLYIERMCEFYARQGGSRFTVIRHSNIYGPHDKFDLGRSHVFGATVAKAMTAADGRLVVWGAGEERRDLLYVSDLVEFVRLAIERQSESFGLYNVGCGHAIPVRSLVEAIVNASGRELRVEHDLARPSIPTSISLDCTRARGELGWQPRVALTDGIGRTLDWYRAAYGAAGAVRMVAR
jgi:GDP-L-fucose synthase